MDRLREWWRQDYRRREDERRAWREEADPGKVARTAHGKLGGRLRMSGESLGTLGEAGQVRVLMAWYRLVRRPRHVRQRAGDGRGAGQQRRQGLLPLHRGP